MIYHLLPEWETFSAYRGGAVAKNVANMMQRDRSRVVVCEAADDTWHFGADRVFVIPGLRVYSCIKGKRFLPLWIHKMLLHLLFRTFLSKVKDGDIVQCHAEPYFSVVLEKPIHLKGAKLIFHSHSPLIPQHVARLFRSFTADRYIFVSEAMQREALQSFPWLKHTCAIHNGADETLFFPLEDRQANGIPVVLFVGRFHPEKGVHILLNAVRILQERKVNVVCRIVGSSFSGGSKPTAYVRRLLKTNLSNVHFADYRSAIEIAREFQNADILCSPSLFQEPFGNVNIEAMACKIPVVASRVGGIPEIAAEGGVALVEPNSPVELANALQTFINDKELRLKFGAEGLRSFKRNFTWNVICKQLQDLTTNLLSESLTTAR
jgi:glycosyltransferase involved in cell wall biosynthesis